MRRRKNKIGRSTPMRTANELLYRCQNRYINPKQVDYITSPGTCIGVFFMPFFRSDIMSEKENVNKLIRVALYIRVSGEEQKIKGLSLESQRERLEAYAKDQGWVIVASMLTPQRRPEKNCISGLNSRRCWMPSGGMRLICCSLPVWIAGSGLSRIIIRSWKFWRPITVNGKP